MSEEFEESGASHSSASQLPVLGEAVAKRATARGHRYAILVHALRCAVVLGLLALLHSPLDNEVVDGQPPSIDRVVKLVPDAVALGEAAEASGVWPVLGHDGEPIASVARTLPAARDVRGYRGPTEALLVLDDQSRIVAADVLTSQDTSEHVLQVREDAAFLDQFRGWDLNDPETASRVDGVSGATLTSLAMAGGLLKRLGAASGSLVFPDSIKAEEAIEFAKKVDENAFRGEADDSGLSVAIFDASGKPLGTVYRSGLFTDDVIGFQGPTELIVFVASDGMIRVIQIRSSFENEPYVEYVKTDKYFWRTFSGKSISELAEFDPVAAGVEGVSGATMTSQSVAATVVETAKQIVRHERELREAAPSGPIATMIAGARSIHFSAREIATLAMLLVAGGLSRLGYQKRPWVRRLWLVTTVIVLGVWTGNLLSMALLAGWASGGIAWQIAPGLAVLVIFALVAPPLAKSNPYCSHLCPHGAIQQLIRPTGSSRRQVRISGRVQRWLKLVPPLTLATAYVMLLVRPGVDLASWEPFHAYLYPIASVATIVIAVLSLVVASMIPMAYCRYGCPTGGLLDYLRRSAASGRIGIADALLVSLMGFGLLWRFM